MLTWRRLERLLIAGAIVALPMRAFAQEAVVTGSVTDTTGGVLPGATVVAVHESTGNKFLAVTDTRGMFRLPVRTGGFKVTAELTGFAPTTKTVELLVGQAAAVDLKLAPAAMQDSVTVTADAPFLDRTISTVGGNVDQRQMQELPLNGRNFVDLTMLAPGSRQNASTDELGAAGMYQLNVDGVRVTQNQTANFGQPKYSRDAIAEFEYITNRFDATQGGSAGTLVNAITKSGTNVFAGTFSGYFRNDRFIAKDFVANRVIPYSDSQWSGTFGGPILKDRLHFFANYEHELEPQTFIHSSQWPTFNFDHSGTRTEKKGLGRGDMQFTPQTRLSVRGNMSKVHMPFDARYTGGAARHPSSAITTERHSGDTSAALTKVLGGSAVNEFRGSYASYYWIQQSIVAWPDHPVSDTRLRHADHPAPRLHHRPGPHQLPRGRAAVDGVAPRQPDVLVRQGRTPRRQGRRRVRAISRTRCSCATAAWASTTRAAGRCRRTSSSCSRCGMTCRPGISRGSLRSCAAIPSASARCSSTRRSTSSPAGCRTTGGSGRG